MRIELHGCVMRPHELVTRVNGALKGVAEDPHFVVVSNAHYDARGLVEYGLRYIALYCPVHESALARTIHGLLTREFGLPVEVHYDITSLSEWNE
jgi:hypothetical protein